jgi:PadR family transcriptional regulator PadR
MVTRVTLPLRLVLEELLQALPDGKRYGLEISEATGLLPGSVYPILQRLHRDGWVTRSQESIDPHEEKRPPRLYYSLTAEGAAKASAVVAGRRGRTRIGGPLPETGTS